MKKVSRQQIEAQISLLRQKVRLQERFCLMITLRGTAERRFIEMLGIAAEEAAGKRIDSSGRTITESYVAAHKLHYQVQSDAADIALAEMKSQLAIAEAILKEAENPSVIAQAGVVLPRN